MKAFHLILTLSCECFFIWSVKIQTHVKNYLKHFNYKLQEDCSCEVCNSHSQLEIHHIQHRSKQQPELDNVENCVCLCRSCHIKAHNNELTKKYLQDIHNRKLEK
jgi:5-methylcytosine-specific restriction endonuclease McrA